MLWISYHHAGYKCNVTQSTLKNTVAKYNGGVTRADVTERCVTEVKSVTGSKSYSLLFIFMFEFTNEKIQNVGLNLIRCISIFYLHKTLLLASTFLHPVNLCFPFCSFSLFFSTPILNFLPRYFFPFFFSLSYSSHSKPSVYVELV